MKQWNNNILELNRLCVNQIDKNQTSYFVGQCLKLLPSPLTIVSYADSNQKHCGYIYQATNWIYTGLSSSEKKVFVNGQLKHRRSLNSEFGTSSVEKLKKDRINIEIEEQEGKHRYFMFLGNKKEKVEMKKALKYKILPYPKGDNKNYDASYQPTIQEKMF
jgi:hypothetical protein